MQEAEKVMRRENMNFEWHSNGDLALWNIANATRQHPETDEEIWFNQAASIHASYYKDMSMVSISFSRAACLLPLGGSGCPKRIISPSDAKI